MAAVSDTRWITALYDAAMAPELWPTALGLIADEVRADVGLLFGIDLTTGGPTMLHCTHGGAPLDALGSRHMDNVWSRAAAQNPAPSVARTEDLVPIEHLIQSSFYSEVLEPAGLFHSLGANLTKSREEIVCVSFLRSRSMRAFNGDDLDWMASAVLHLQRASQVARRLAGADLLCSAALDTLNLLKSPVFLLDGDARVLFVNRAAEALLEGPSGISLHDGRLRAYSREGSSRIDRLFWEAVNDDAHNGGYVAVPRRDHSGSVLFLLARLGETSVCVGGRVPRFVLLAGTEGAVDVPGEVLQEAFALTEREATVAGLLAAGHGLPVIARILGVSLNTVRTHAARVYDKTGTAGQAQLIRELLCLVPHGEVERESLPDGRFPWTI